MVRVHDYIDICASPQKVNALEATLARLGVTLIFARNNPLYIILPCLIAPVLYLGPLYADYLSEALPLQRRWNFHDKMLSMFTTLIGLRNYIVVSPYHELPAPMRCSYHRM